MRELPEDKAVLPRICESIRLGLERPNYCGQERRGAGKAEAQSGARTSFIVVISLRVGAPTKVFTVRKRNEGNEGDEGNEGNENKIQSRQIGENLAIRL